MSGLKQLRNRIRSIKSTQKITKAMHVVSAAKLKKVKDQAENLNEYSDSLKSIMQDLSTDDNLINLPETDQRFFCKTLEDMTHLLVVMTSERGLCGSFNSNIIKRVKKDIALLQKQGKNVKILAIGKKAKDALAGQYYDIIEEYYPSTKNNVEHLSDSIKSKIISLVEEGEVGACSMYYNRFKNAMTQITTKECILPAKITEDDETSDASIYEYEGTNLVHQVIDLYINGEITYGLLQSKASEEGARMTAMDSATKNAGELIDKLTLKLNRSRQAIITTELTEIISGAEAV
ncbi:MAG: ATP synthase F1 subunit gamma [Rickettsiaceae bacterium]|nr:ATP synthase F1 subunit gamma [Rickettsiaceae bacterium]